MTYVDTEPQSWKPKPKGEALGERSQIQLNSEKTTELRGSRTDLNSLIWKPNHTRRLSPLSVEPALGHLKGKDKGRQNELIRTSRALRQRLIAIMS